MTTSQNHEIEETMEGSSDPSPSLSEILRQHDVRHLRLQYCDVLGRARHVEVPVSRFEHAADGRTMFDGSAVEGPSRIEETDMLLRPDPSSFWLLSDGTDGEHVGLIACDVLRTDGSAFEGDPRGALRRVIRRAEEEGWELRIGTEIECFLLPQGPETGPPLRSAPNDPRVETALRALVGRSERAGIDVRTAQRKTAPGQIGLVLGETDALRAADRLLAVKELAKAVARRHGLVATFMPKPFEDLHGSGLHLHVGLYRDGANAFSDPELADELSDTLRSYVAGLLRHARGFCAISSPLANSYKRFVPGYEAPVSVAWSLYGGSPLVRIPGGREDATRCELRMADPAANPYLLMAVQLVAGLAGIEEEASPGEPLRKNSAILSERERRRLKIAELPGDLGEALSAFEADRVVRAALGEHIFARYVAAKRSEWAAYRSQVSPWELQEYFDC